jgi:TolB protein
MVYSGPDFAHLALASQNDTALHPAFSPTGKLAFSGSGRYGQRIYVDDKPVSPDGLHSSSPTFCRHPEGIRLVYMVGVNQNMDLVVTGETGGGMGRLTQGKGRNTYPACSPDGRLIAFFSTRKTGEGPGLYIMRIDGRRPKRVSTLVGDSLRWARVPEVGKPAGD